MAKDKEKKKVPFNTFRKGLAGALIGATILAGGIGLAGCGKTGPQGPQGETGDAGKPGATWYSGTEVDSQQGVLGDFFYDTDDCNIYLKLETGWTKISNIQGKPGDPGDPGDDGKDGLSWITGSGVPSVDTGKNGDTYLDIVTNFVYTKTNGLWTKMGELAGDRDIDVIEQASPWKGKTAVFVGDSITFGAGCDGQKYWEILKDELGFSQVTGMGVNGSCISEQSDYGTERNPLINRYQDIPEVDLIQIFMGTNDYGHGTPLGNIDDTTDVSFYGALNVILPSLQQKYPTARIVVVTPLHRYNANAGATELTYDYLPHPVTGKTLADYVDALKEVCQRYSIPVIDLFNISGINPSVESMKDMYMPDGIHPNAKGHELIANLMKQHLNLLATGEEQTEVVPNYEMELVSGNKFASDTATQSNAKRATTAINTYIEEGTIIKVKDKTTHSFAVYSQTSTNIVVGTNISGGFVDEFVVETSGYYGFVIKRNDDVEFNFSTMSKDFVDYVDINDQSEEVFATYSLAVGNLFGTGATLTDRTRATLEKNIYLEEGTVITTKNSAKNNLAVYSQAGEEIVTTTNISGGYVETFTIQTEGWYGFVLNNTAEFDFETEGESLLDYVTVTVPQDEVVADVIVEAGSKYGAGYETNSARASSKNNVYLEEGTTIKLVNTDYLMALYPQSSETQITQGSNITSGWTGADFVITESGYYGFAFKRTDDRDFAFDSTDSINLADYVVVLKQLG